MLRAMLFGLAIVVLVLLGGATIAGAASYAGDTGAAGSGGVPVPVTGASVPGNVPQPVPSCPAGVNYTVASAPVAAPPNTPALKDDTGNHCDDCVTSVELPFVQHFYGETFAVANLSSNGVLYFSNSAASETAHDSMPTALPSRSLAYAIMPYWQDLTTDASGDGIYTAVSGADPHRTLSIEWRAHTKGGAPVGFEMRLYEGRDAFSIVYRQVPDGGRGATVGAQGGNFTIGGKPYTQQVSYSYREPSLRAGLQLDFDRSYTTCICDPTACDTPTPEGTPTATPTEVCSINVSGGSASCTLPGTVSYDFPFTSMCQSRILFGNYTAQVMVAPGSGGPWTLYATQSGSRSFLPGVTHISGGFDVQNVPPQYLYYQARISASFDNGQQVSTGTVPQTICRPPTPAATSTITNTPSNTSTSTATNTATITPTPCGANAEQMLNGGFEYGNFSGWTAYTVNNGNQVPSVQAGSAHQGFYYADLTANDNLYPTHQLVVAQAVYVPAQGGTLSFWVMGQSYGGYAVLQINNTVVALLNLTPNWYNQTFDLTSYASQTISIYFWSQMSAVRLDDVSFIAPWPCNTATATTTTTGTATATSTAAPTQPPALVGHVLWQGVPAQPDPRQQQPITLTIKAGGTEVDYLSQTTDASGFFTVPLGSLPSGTYQWRAKGPKFLANSGSVGLAGPDLRTSEPSKAQTLQLEIGLMRAGDADNDNYISASDFNILRASFGKGLGDPGYDPRADFDNDNTVGASDFNLLKSNYGNGGAPQIGPGGP